MKRDASARDAAVAALMDLTPVLVRVATHAAEAEDPTVPLARFRLLRLLAERGATASSTAAELLATVPSTVTRLADRLEASGHLRRRRERPNRSVVTLELTDVGVDLVARVLARRRDGLDRLVAGLDDTAAARLADGLAALRAAATATDPADPAAAADPEVTFP